MKSIEGDSPGLPAAGAAGAREAARLQGRDGRHRARLLPQTTAGTSREYALQAILDGAGRRIDPAARPGNPEGLLLRGLIERESGPAQAGARRLRTGDRAKRPDLFEAYVNLGEMKLEAGNASEAQAPLESAVRYAPNVAIAHLDLGDCYRLLGRTGGREEGARHGASAWTQRLRGSITISGCSTCSRRACPGRRARTISSRRRSASSRRTSRCAGAKTPKGPGDDVDELLSTAKRKQSELQLKKQAAAAAPPPATPPRRRPSQPLRRPAPPSPAPGSSNRASVTARGLDAAGASSGNIVRDLPK